MEAELNLPEAGDRRSECPRGGKRRWPSPADNSWRREREHLIAIRHLRNKSKPVDVQGRNRDFPAWARTHHH
ncbi:hypothetical protein BST61_g4103 [Cercospora zeina]